MKDRLMKLTMKEIAERTGVSPATVSRIMNGNAGVAPEKRETVMRLIAEESRNNRTVRHRKNRRIKNIGLMLLPGSQDDKFNAAVKVFNAADNLPDDYELHLIPNSINPHRLESRFLRGELSGLLLCGHRIKDPVIGFLLDRIPHVWLNSYHADGKTVPLMGNDFAGKTAANYLLKSGCRRLALLSFQTKNTGLPERITGFLIQCSLHGHAVREIKLNPGSGAELDLSDKAWDALENEIDNALGCIPENEFPDGIFSPEEALTPHLYRVFRKIQLRKYPRVISCNYTPEYLAGLFPRPASIDLHPEILIKSAVNELIHRIEGKKALPDNIAAVVQPQLIPGEE